MHIHFNTVVITMWLITKYSITQKQKRIKIYLHDFPAWKQEIGVESIQVRLNIFSAPSGTSSHGISLLLNARIDSSSYFCPCASFMVLACAPQVLSYQLDIFGLILVGHSPPRRQKDRLNPERRRSLSAFLPLANKVDSPPSARILPIRPRSDVLLCATS